ncbi:MAG: DUF736 domain-containing protein [Pseudomonadota bacterium]
MATIGTFKTTATGFSGSIRTLLCTAKVTLRRTETDAVNAPDYRLFAGAGTGKGAGTIELGAAWAKTARDGRAYLSVKLDDPSFDAPIYARLVASEDGSHALLWSRPSRD